MFIAVAEEKGFRAAGRRLGVSGSAVGQTNSQLEERLEVPLFLRTTRTVRLTEEGRDFAVNVESRVLTTDPALNIRLAMAGIGLTITYEGFVRPQVEGGSLVRVLEEYCEPFPGFFLYFPRRRHRSAALRALIEFVRKEVNG